MNRHRLRELHGRYVRWDAILRDILNEKIEIVQNRIRTDSETEADDDDVDDKFDEDTPDETGAKAYDTYWIF